MQLEPVPFISERTKELRGKLTPMSRIAPVLDQPQLVRGWLTTGGLSVVYGPSNCGKTFFVADLAMHIASGTSWRGNRVKAGNVVFVAGEGGQAIQNRFAAMWQAKREICDDRFHLLSSGLDLSGQEDALALSQLLPDEPVELIVIDTLARSIGNGDENAAKDIGVFVQNLDKIREQTGAHVLVVHHSGKDVEKGARGSSALRAAVDTEIAITADKAVKVRKQRDLETPKPIFFDLEQVELGVDGDGETVTSAIVIDADAPKAKKKPLTGRKQVALNALIDALRKHGKQRAGEGLPEGRLTVEVSVWRQEAHRASLANPKADTSAKSKAFTRARVALVDEDVVCIYGDYVWLVSKDLEPS